MNRRFKVLFTFVALLFVTLTLVACTNQAKKDTNAVAEAKESLVVGFTDSDTSASVTKNVTLKATEGEVAITWVSNNAAVITNAGVVTRPEADTVVELTATLKKGEATDSKKFSLTVKAAEVVVDPDIAIVAGVKDALALGFATGDTAAAVTQNLTLKTTEEGVAITWASDKTAVITNAGVVTRPAEDAAVKLTATLTKGAVKETKVFDVTVLAAEVVETGAKAALVAHYADTFEDVEWLATEDVVLVDTITGSDDNDYDVTWEIITGADFVALDGKITRPSFTVGDQTVQLRASIEDGSSQDFYFTIKSLDQTDEEKITAALNQVTAGQVFPSGYQELNFVTVETVKIDDVDVTVTWESSDITVMTHTGELVAFEDAEFKEVSLTATLTFNGLTESKTVEFKVLGVKTFSNFNDALSTENFSVVSGSVIGAKVKVEGVALYKDIVDGFYLVSEGNRLGFVYGNRDNNIVKAGKLYDVTFNVDVYFGTYQLNGASFSNERDGEIPTVTPLEVTLEDIVTLPKPSNTTPNHHTLYKLVDVEARIDPRANTDERYNTFFVPVGLEAEEVLTDQNSIMIYYKSDLDVIKSLNGQTILSIEVINNGYRTNNIVWNVNFIGSIDDVELDLTVEDRVSIIKNGFEAAIPASILKNMELDLPTTKDEATITWESTNLDVIALDGTVTLPAESTTVTLKATIVLEGVTEVFEKEVEIDVLPTTTIAEALLSPAADKELFKVEGIVTGISGNNTYSFEDASGAIAIFSSVKLDVGFEYILFGTRDAYNGLEQLRYVDAIKGEAKALPAAAVLTEADLTNEVLLPLQSRLVSIENATVTTVNADQYGNISLTLTVGSKTINLRWDNRVVLPAGAADHLESIKQGAIVNIVSAPLGWSNNPQLGYNDASQIVIPVAETDQQKVDAAALALDLPTSLAKAEALTLPLEGEYEVAISWASSHVDIIAADGTVVLPETDTDVTLTATLTLGVVTKDVEFVITVVSSDGMTVAMARAVASGSVVVQGIVTGIANYESGDVKYIFLSDADGTTIALFNPTDAESLVLGDLVKVTGTRAAFNGLEQVTGATVIVLESEQTVPAATVLTEFPTFTAGDQGKRYSIEGLTVVSASGQNLVVTDGTTQLTVRVDINKGALTDHIATAVGKKVDLVNIHLGWFNSAQFLMFNTSEVVIAELTDQDKLDADKAALELAETYTEEHTLPVLGENGSVITWVADPAASLVDGKLVIPAEGEDVVTLTATLTLGTLSDTKEFTVTLKELGEVVEFHETFDNSTATASYGNGSFTGVNGVVWTFVHARDEEATPIDGKGIMLRRSDEPSSLSATFANGIVEFSFEYRKAFTSGTARKYSVDVTHNGETTTYELPQFGSGSGADDTAHSFKQLLNLSGEVVIKIYATGATGNQQATFDNFKWSEFPE